MNPDPERLLSLVLGKNPDPCPGAGLGRFCGPILPLLFVYLCRFHGSRADLADPGCSFPEVGRLADPFSNEVISLAIVLFLVVMETELSLDDQVAYPVAMSSPSSRPFKPLSHCRTRSQLPGRTVLLRE